MKSNIELLAPAGNMESLHAAIQAGADAVYFGVEQLNMRAKSIHSFSLGELDQIAAICHASHIRSYITLNTVMYDHDMQLLRNILLKVKSAGIDGVIAADFAVIEICQQLQIPLHISTQANVSNLEAVQFFARFAEVIVLARELTLKQIEQITREIKRKDIRGVSGEPIKIEVFVHGALCMAISGKCYISLHEQNASANRGACTQNCRRAYLVKDAETGEELLIDNEYIMSPKDLSTIDLLDQIVESGVQVLKIEGRGKSPEYVFTVTKAYREALHAIETGKYTREKIMELQAELSKVYNRGFWEGYYLGRKLGQWANEPGSIAREKKIYTAKGTKYFPRIQVGEFLIESGTLQNGDQLLITSPQFGIVRQALDQLRVNGLEKSIGVKGDRITFPFEKKITGVEKLYKIIANPDGKNSSLS